MNIYETEFFCVCPNNGIRIQYRLQVETHQMIAVEEIIETVSGMKSGYHEVVADQLHRLLGGRQKLTAEHHGVRITTIRGVEK